MNQNEILAQTKDACLCLIHPAREGEKYRQEIAPVLSLAASVPDPVVATMITGASWRERLLGLCIAMAKGPSFTDSMVQSLREPRGISIVPTSAALAVLARSGDFPMTDSFAQGFDRAAFDGEVGWAVDKAMHLAGLQGDDVPGRGPNYGQVFEDHVEVYRWIRQGA